MGFTTLRNLLPDSYGKIWVATDSGIRIIDVNRNLIKSFTVNQGLSDTIAYGSLRDEENEIWIATYNGLDIINAKRDSITYLKKENGLSSDKVWSITEDKEKKIWAFDPRFGLNVIDRQAAAITRVDFSAMNMKSTS